MKLHGLQNEKKALIHDAEQANLRLVELQGELEERNKAVEKAGEDLAGLGLRIEQLCAEKEEVEKQVKHNVESFLFALASHVVPMLKYGSSPLCRCNLQLQESVRVAEESSQILKTKLQAALSEEVSLVERLQRLEVEKTALEEELATFKIDQSDSVWSLESRLLQCESERDALQAQEKELRAELESVKTGTVYPLTHQNCI